MSNARPPLLPPSEPQPFYGPLYLVAWFYDNGAPAGAAIREQIPTGPLETGGGWSKVVVHHGTTPRVLRRATATGDYASARAALLNAVKTDPELAFLRGDTIRDSELWYDIRGIVVGRPLLIADGPRVASIARRPDWG